jgi:hypothetical protein
LGIDTIFPIVLILAGLALSTVAIFKNGTHREMTATLYPTPLKIIQNSQSAFSNQSYIEAFIKNNMVDNSQYPGDFQTDGLIDISIGDNKLDLFTQLEQFDDQLFKEVNAAENAKGPYWGQIYINSINDLE